MALTALVGNGFYKVEKSFPLFVNICRSNIDIDVDFFCQMLFLPQLIWPNEFLLLASQYGSANNLFSNVEMALPSQSTPLWLW